MYISKLSLYGFKSFLKKSEVEFGKGITAVVGPNGCGKTNIVDAIRWVIGEQKSSVLRADRITDVIFNGTSTRRPLNLAEVSLTIHNVSGRIPIQYSDIEITRRVYRNGESEYFINKHLCRLKDITDLFIDTGMGANAYSIIELKMIEDILSETPEERKRLFEEAAGVNKYRVQRRTAIRKLEATKDDLLRLNDIIGEVETKVKSLRRQLRRYERFQEITQNLIETEVLLATRRLMDIRQQEQPLRDEIEAHRSALQKTAGQLQKTQENWDREQAQLEQNETELEARESELDRSKTDTNHLITESSVLKEKEKSLQRNIERLQTELLEADDQLDRYARKTLELEKSGSGYQEQLAKQKSELNTLLGKHEDVEKRFHGLDAELQELKDQRYQLLRTQAEGAAKLENLQNNIAERKAEFQSVESQIHKAEMRARELSGRITEQTAERQDLHKKHHASEEKLAALLAEKNQLTERNQEQTFALQKLSLATERIESQIQFYRSIIESREGYSPAIQYISQHRQEFTGIIGPLSEQFTVQAPYERAALAVLGDVSHLLLAETRSAALATIDRLEESGKGQVKILALDGVSKRKHSAAPPDDWKLPCLAKWIDCRAELQPLVDLLFADVYVVEDADFAKAVADPQLAELVLVTPNAKVCDQSGLFTGGRESSSGELLLGRSQKLAALEAELTKVRDEYATASDQQRKLATQIDELQAQASAVRQEQTEMQAQIEQIEKSLRSDEAHQIETESILKTLGENRLTLKVAIENFQQRLDSEDPGSHDLEQNILDLEGRIEQKKGEVQEARVELETLSKELQRRRVEVVNLENRQRNATEDLAQLENSMQETRVDKDRYQREKADTEEQKRELVTNIEQLDLEIEQQSQKLSEKQAAVEKLRQVHQERRARLQKLNESLFTLRHRKEQLTQKMRDSEMQLSEFTAQEKQIRSVLQEKYEREPVSELPEGTADEEALVRKVNRYKKNLEEIGMVNMAVKEEFEQESARLDFLVDQRNDLLESEEGLNEVIEQIDNIAREQYLEVFGKIQENFKSTFQVFFGGGEAEVKLIGEGDPLESKVEIWACPSGKKMRSLKMLSAGEKALTAIALLFAIYQVKPSPFCILDEVDAPLDDENTRRFTNVIRTFSQNTQFIVVTHNKLSMSIADALYGVTMGESGVSQIVSVKLE